MNAIFRAALTILPSVLLVVACSAFNREGPIVTCAALDGGAINACKDGIIASCADGKKITYQVCTGDEGADTCESKWQTKGAFTCEQPRANAEGPTGASSGGTSCLPAGNSRCASCLQSQCHTAYTACALDTTCATTCKGPQSAEFLTCLKQCQAGDFASCPASSTGGSPTSNACPSGAHRCGDGVCVVAGKTCDGRNDCGDGSDESTATCAVQVTYTVNLICAGVTSLEVSFFDYDAEKAAIKSATVGMGPGQYVIVVPCRMHHRVCFGAKSTSSAGTGTWGAYTAGTSELSSTPDPQSCFVCEKGVSASANLACR